MSRTQRRSDAATPGAGPWGALTLRWVAVAVAVGTLGACGRDLLPSGNFGSLGDSADEAPTGADEIDSGVADGSSGGEGTASGTTADATGTADGDSQGVTTEPDGSSGEDSSGAEGSMSGASSGSEDPDRGEFSEDPDEGMDTWGIPPDVTNEPCAPLAQDCFPTHKCVPYATAEGSNFLDANKCMPILGDKAWGEGCTLSGWNEAQDDCDGEGFCWNLEWVGAELQGTCVPFCVGSPQSLMCPEGWGCLFSGAVALCAKQCHPLAQDCPLDYGCYWVGNGFDCGLVASPAQDLEACDMTNDCVPGLACVDKSLVPECAGADASCCTPWCDATAPDSCAAPRSCVPFFEPDQAPPGFDDVGVCILP